MFVVCCSAASRRSENFSIIFMPILGYSSINPYISPLVISQVCEITKGDIYGLMEEYPNIGIKIIEKFSERLEAAEQQTTNISLLSSKERLLEYIRSHVDADDYVNLDMTKRDLSSYLSMQPETLTRLFKKLEAAGDIEKLDNKTYKVLNYSIL